MFKDVLRIALFSCLLFLTACGGDEPVTSPEAVEEPKPEIPANPRFKLLGPAETGLQFSNTIKEDLSNNILVNSYLYNGGGVAVIDVNNDGLPDLYFTATQEPNRLFLNKGNLKFEDITTKAGVEVAVGQKTGVAVADVNADGFQDLYICRSGKVPGLQLITASGAPGASTNVKLRGISSFTGN